MRKNLLNALAIGAGLALGASATAITQPALVNPAGAPAGTYEFVSTAGVVSIFVADAALADGEAINVTAQVFTIDAANNVTNIGGAVTIPNSAKDADGNGTFGEVADNVTPAGDLTLILNLADGGIPAALGNNINTAIAAAGATGSVGIQFDVADANDGDATTGLTTTNPTTLTDGFFDAAATSPQLLSGTNDIVNVFIDTSGANPVLLFEFAQPLTNGAAGNTDIGPGGDLNNTEVADIVAANIEFDSVNTFAGANNPGGITNVTIQGPSDNVLSVEVNTNPAPAAGDFVRFVGGTVRDFTGRLASADTNGAQSLAFTDLAVTSAVWTSPTTVDVFFSRDVNQAALPSGDAFDLLVVAGGTANDPYAAAAFDNADVAAGPTTNSFTLTRNAFTTGGTAGLVVASDGLADSAANQTLFPDLSSFRIVATDGTTDIEDSLGTAAFQMTDGTATIGDEIAPAAVARSFHDLDGDGVLDAVALIFDEPMGANPGAAGLTLRAVNGVTIRPFSLIDPSTAEIMEETTDIAASPDDELAIDAVSLAGFDVVGVPTGRSTDNAIVLAFDPEAFPFLGTGSAGEGAPGTPDSSAFSIQSDDAATGAALSDAAGNEAASSGPTAATVDLAPPVLFASFFYSGDNQAPVTDNLFNASNAQFLSEQDGAIGDQDFNNRATLYFSEDVSAGGAGAVVPSTVLYGPDFTAFTDNDDVGGDFVGFDSPGGVYSNGVIFNLRETNEQNEDTSGLQPGVQVSIDSGSGIEDAGGNEVTVDGAILDNRTAPYVAIQADVNDDEFVGAYLLDDDDDNLVDRILLIFTEPIDPATLDAADFTTSRGTVTGVGLDSADGTQRTVEISISGSVSIESTVSVTYNADADANALVASDETAGGLGNAVDDVTTTITEVQKLQAPAFDTDAVAIQPIVGTVTINGEPVQQGTKVFASVAVPTVFRVEAIHNNVFFQYRRNFEPTPYNFEESSLDEWTSWLLGVFPDLYLSRNSDNEQIFDRVKDDSNDVPSDIALGDTIRLTINANNLTNISFSGNGETNTDRVQNGRAFLAWDLLRSNDGRLASFFQDGYVGGGEPIVSSAVIDNADGQHSLHVSAPISAFSGMSRFNSIGWPIIVWVELPDGTRQVASSLLTSVNGAPINFNPANRNQNQGNAPNALSFNINLDNIGVERVFEGWNTVPFGRNGGWAGTQSQVPVRPDGVSAPTNDSTSPIQVGSNGNLPAVGALEQFVWFTDTDNDGMWSRRDDGARFDGIVIDSKFVPNFAFTMTSFGVQAGSSINSIVGGYAFGFFSNVNANLGLFQFGAPLDQPAFFTANPFPNNTTTQGWALLSRTQSGEITSSVGSRVDYVIWFNNRGIDGIQVRSLAVQNPSGTNNPNDLGEIPAADIPAALFTHFQP